MGAIQPSCKGLAGYAHNGDSAAASQHIHRNTAPTAGWVIQCAVVTVQSTLVGPQCYFLFQPAVLCMVTSFEKKPYRHNYHVLF